MKESGIGVLSLLGIIFIVFKLAKIGEIANWSWIWVLSPFWIGIAVVLLVIIVFFVLAFVFDRPDKIVRRR